MDALTFFLNLPNEVRDAIQEAINQYGNNYMKAINPTNRSKVKAARKMYEIMDKSTSDFLKDNPATCRKGCAFCCYVYIETTIDEALVIKNYCNQHNITIDKEALEKQKNLELNTWNGHKCVFLGDDNTCSIYEVRPMTCRKYYVASEPKLCNTRIGTNRIAILHNLDAEVMAAGIFGVRDTGSLPGQLLKIIEIK
jgi:Fe-S-cluster containining protein